jgi:protein O-mannosyl-transferase
MFRAARWWGPRLLVVAGTLFATWLIYRPGLNSGFIFDDYANLPILGATGPVEDAASLLRYLTAGRADPLGRPVALASFLLDAHDWPASPYPFKLTNVLLHALNGLLLLVVLLRLGTLHSWGRRRRWIAAGVGAGCWVLHPFFVSTVLYVVQREAMLPVTFALTAILSYLSARRVFVERSRLRASAWLVMGTTICTLLATLSKANGLLVPLLVWLVHFTLPPLRGHSGQGFQRLCVAVFGPTTAFVVIHVLWMALSSIGASPISIRGWSIGQRLLTEGSILWNYMAHLWLVLPVDSSLLHDDVRVFEGTGIPWLALTAWGAWLAVGCLALALRRVLPALSLGILFFLAGHLLESTAIPLELYFDHRNYLPAIFLFWSLGSAIARGSNVIAGVSGLALGGLLGTLTFATASLWGTPVAQAASWAAVHPASARAQAYATQSVAEAGNMRLARNIIERAASRFTDEPQVAMNLLDLHCAIGGLLPTDVPYAALAFRTARREPGPLLLTWMQSAVETSRSGSCLGLDRQAVAALLDAATDNPRIWNIAGRRQDIMHVRGVEALAWDDPAGAASWFNKALAQAPTPEVALSQAADLARVGRPDLGLAHLEYFRALPAAPAPSWQEGMPALHAWLLTKQGYWPHEIAHLERKLRAANHENP